MPGKLLFLIYYHLIKKIDLVKKEKRMKSKVNLSLCLLYLSLFSLNTIFFKLYPSEANEPVLETEDQLRAAPSRPNIAGLPDKSFGNNGIVQIPIPEYAALQFQFADEAPPYFIEGYLPQAKLVVDAQRRSVIAVSQVGYFVVYRLLENGTLDTTFGDPVQGSNLRQGRVMTKIARYPFDYIPPNQEAHPPYPQYGYASSQAITVNQAGKVIVAGIVNNYRWKSHILVAQYNYFGELDTSFGGVSYFNGKKDSIFGTSQPNPQYAGLTEITFPFEAEVDSIRQVVCDFSGRILILGIRYDLKSLNPVAASSFIIALTPDGKLDTSFGNNGIAEYSFSTNVDTYFRSLIFDVFGNIIVGGSISKTTIFSPPVFFNGYEYNRYDNTFFIIIRFSNNGVLDETFGPEKKGYILYSANSYPYDGWYAGGGGSGPGCYITYFDPFGRLLIGGYSDLGKFLITPSDIIPTVLRYNLKEEFQINVDYVLDKSFGVQGRSLLKSQKDVNIYDLTVDVRGNILVAGMSGENISISRLLNSGELDKTYGAAKTGQVILNTPFPLTPPEINLDGSGRLYLSSLGLDGLYPPTPYIVIARYTSDYIDLFINYNET